VLTLASFHMPCSPVKVQQTLNGARNPPSMRSAVKLVQSAGIPDSHLSAYLFHALGSPH